VTRLNILLYLLYLDYQFLYNTLSLITIFAKPTVIL